MLLILARNPTSNRERADVKDVSTEEIESIARDVENASNNKTSRRNKRSKKKAKAKSKSAKSLSDSDGEYYAELSAEESDLSED